ncbi:AraC family transcriptional regulator [uncultured Shimia sp.]|uniref:AraC family transcriptional regulator n=1 Tax=uncultured Shimia sp. TaxID=573152 RepID=UPI003454A8A5
MSSEVCDTSTIVFNATQDDGNLWPYHVPVAGLTVARHDDGMVRQNYHQHVLILSLSGLGCVELGRERFELLPGDLAWIDTALSYAHGADAKSDWTYLWMSFAGYRVNALHAHLGFEQVPVVHGCADQRPRFEAVKEALSVNSVYLPALVSAKISELLADLSVLRRAQGHTGPSGVVMRVSHRLRSQLDRAWSVEGLAEIAGISQSQLFRRFREETGSSPMAWLRRERMVLACYLLRTTEQPISHVALKCGYADPFHFSRDFKRHQGRAPRYFRAAVRREA